MSSAKIGKAVGRARRTVDSYLTELKTVAQVKMDLKLYKIYRVEIPQERIATRLDETRERIRNHLGDPAILPDRPNSDLKQGFTVSQIAEKHDWRESLIWAIKWDGKKDATKYHELQWG